MTHTEIPNTAAELLELLHNMGENGLHIRELAHLNDLSGGFCNQLGLRFTEADRERTVAELHVTQEHLQITGIVNGGVLCDRGNRGFDHGDHRQQWESSCGHQ